MKLLFATRNPHKLQEIRAVFALPHLEVGSAFDYPDLPDVVEDGETLEANAIKKAATLARQTAHWCLADDTGLEVRALGGAPGVYSARYAGEEADYAANNRKLLGALEGVADRRARFRSVVALASPSGMARTVEGRCEGVICDAPRGVRGFGYDPVFLPDGQAGTFAEMDAERKNAISHRGRALAAARAAWGELLGRAPADWPSA